MSKKYQWRQESAEKNYSNKYQVSRIHREELQQENTNSVKDLPRINTARRKPMGSRIRREDIEEETNGEKKQQEET